jgi:putative glycosyltransferase (TIGR04372 family)
LKLPISSSSKTISIFYPGVHRAAHRFLLARWIFARLPHFLNVPLFVIWRSFTRKTSLDQFFEIPSSRYRSLFLFLTRFRFFAETAQFALNSAAVGSAVCDIVEYGPDAAMIKANDRVLDAVKILLHHQEFNGLRMQARYSSAVDDEMIYEDDDRLRSLVGSLSQMSRKQRAVLGGWLFFALRKLLLILYHDGHGEKVPAVGQRSLDLQMQLRSDPPRPSRALQDILDARGIDYRHLLLLSPDWSALIGHIGHLDVHLRMRDMGWWTGAPLLATYGGKIANRPFLSLLEERCPVVVLEEGLDQDAWVELCALAKYFGVSHQVWGTDQRPMGYWNDWGSVALQEWTAHGRGYPMLDAYDRRFQHGDEAQTAMANMRKHFGMTASDRYVCLHMRDANTRGEKAGVGETVRNAGFANYLATVKHITAQGLRVIRMGGSNVPELPRLPGVIDYARSAFRSPLMDLHLVRNAQYFIGTTSGFAYVATSLNVPTVMVNCISSVGLLWTERTRFALKPVRTTSGRLLSQRELTSDRWRWSFPTFESLKAAGLELSESSSDEILETVKEVELLALGNQVRSPLIEAWRASLTIPGFFGASLPSSYFLEKHRREFLA